MENIFDNYRMIEEVKERTVKRSTEHTEFESYDRVAKIEFKDVRRKDLVDFGDCHPNGK